MSFTRCPEDLTETDRVATTVLAFIVYVMKTEGCSEEEAIDKVASLCAHTAMSVSILAEKEANA